MSGKEAVATTDANLRPGAPGPRAPAPGPNSGHWQPGAVTATCLGPNLKSAPYASISLIQPVLLKFTRTIKYFFTSRQSILNNSSCIL